MLRTRSDSNELGGNLSQNWKPFQQAKDKGQRLPAIRHTTSNHATMNEDLHCLNKTCRPFTSHLYFAQIFDGKRTASQFFGEQICRRDGILNSEIDAHAACR